MRGVYTTYQWLVWAIKAKKKKRGKGWLNAFTLTESDVEKLSVI